MVASPEICRINGAKSRGAISPRGKAIAARNATKHGLLAKQPPLLVTEDLATFEGLVQGLIDQYQPETPVEHFLVQQVAMGMLKQYRLWTVEAAIANLSILKAQQANLANPPIGIAAVDEIEQGIREARITKQGIQQPEMFDRYQRQINRDLYEALDRLDAIQQRRHRGSMGSFGQT